MFSSKSLFCIDLTEYPRVLKRTSFHQDSCHFEILKSVPAEITYQNSKETKQVQTNILHAQTLSLM